MGEDHSKESDEQLDRLKKLLSNDDDADIFAQPSVKDALTFFRESYLSEAIVVKTYKGEDVYFIPLEVIHEMGKGVSATMLRHAILDEAGREKYSQDIAKMCIEPIEVDGGSEIKVTGLALDKKTFDSFAEESKLDRFSEELMAIKISDKKNDFLKRKKT